MSAEYDNNLTMSIFSKEFDRIFGTPNEVTLHRMLTGGDVMSFSELRQKDVINVFDGRKLGRPIDLILNDSNCVDAIVVPNQTGGLLNFFRQDKDGCVIPWSKVRRIGDDVILVEVDSERFYD